MSAPTTVTMESTSPSTTTNMMMMEAPPSSHEKTIPFLSRLVDMLSENEGVISFVPGSTKKNTLGKIVVHDRIKLSADVLPRFFNHSSFASLRRQLNYFSFARQGKGRQKCATYSNDQVIVLQDILRLRRRPAAATGGRPTGGSESSMSMEDVNVESPNAAAGASPFSSMDNNSSSSSTSKKRSRHGNDSPRSNNSGSVHSSSSSKKMRQGLTTITTTPSKILTSASSSSSSSPATTAVSFLVSPNLISPRSSPSHSATASPNNGKVRIVLDLTVPSSTSTFSPVTRIVSEGSMHSRHLHKKTTAATTTTVAMEEDVVAGCQALLSLKHTPSMTMAW